MQDPPLIFVVDDDNVLCEQVVTYLTSHGFEARAFSGISAVEAALEKEPCALLLLDIMLPGEDGLSFCRRLRAQSGVPVIFLSALGELTDRVVGLEIGADDYLVKPLSVPCCGGWKTWERLPLPLPPARSRRTASPAGQWSRAPVCSLTLPVLRAT